MNAFPSRSVLFAVLIGCAIPTFSAAQGVPGALAVEPYRFEFLDYKVDAQLGRLTVPEKRDAANGKTIEIAFMRYPAAGTASIAPIVYLAGGPGGAGIGIAKSQRIHLFMALRSIADVIVVDQRGVGLSRPNLECEHRWDLPLDAPANPDLWMESMGERAQACAAHWRAVGVDLAAYTTEENADDIDELRSALGLEKINLWGTSYGTHLGLSYIRRHGTHVERAVLTGVEGPDHTLKLPSTIQKHLELVHALMANDAEAHAAIPDLLALVASLSQQLEAHPETVDLGSEGAITLGKFDLQLYTSEAVGRVNTIRGMPLFFYEMSQGDFRRLARWSSDYRSGRVGSAMSWAMDCASGATRSRLARIEKEAAATLLGDAINFPFPAIGDSWGVDPLSEEFRSPIHSETPVLFISGSLDGRTPPENADEIAAGFPNAQRLLVEGVGHEEELFSLTAGVSDAMIRFYKGERLDTSRLQADPARFTRVRLKD